MLLKIVRVHTGSSQQLRHPEGHGLGSDPGMGLHVGNEQSFICSSQRRDLKGIIKKKSFNKS